MMSNELKIAIRLVKKTGKKLIKNINKSVIVRFNEDKRNITTSMDVCTEKMIAKEIKKIYPSHQIYGEERFQGGKSNYTWFIDSIDGTKYYQVGIKFFSVSISLWHNNKPILGVVYIPATDDLYWAEIGKGSYCNKKMIQVSKRKDLNQSIICLDTGRLDNLNKQNFNLKLKKIEYIFKNFYRVRIFGWGSASLCFLANGYFDAYFDLSGRVKIYDLAAGLVIAKEAGAKITSLDGKFHGEEVGGVVVTNKKIHKKVLSLVNKK